MGVTAAKSGCGKAISVIRYFRLSGTPLEQRGPDSRGSTVYLGHGDSIHSSLYILTSHNLNLTQGEEFNIYRACTNSLVNVG